MASNPYVKSIIWLATFGGIGYGLMELTKPSEAKLAKIRATTGSVHLTEEEKKKIVFLKKLQQSIVPVDSKKEATD